MEWVDGWMGGWMETRVTGDEEAGTRERVSEWGAAAAAAAAAAAWGRVAAGAAAAAAAAADDDDEGEVEPTSRSTCQFRHLANETSR